MAQGKGKAKKNTYKKQSKRKTVKRSGGARTGAPKKRKSVVRIGDKIRHSVTQEINRNIEEIMKARVLNEGKRFKVVGGLSDESVNIRSAPKTGAARKKKAFGDISRQMKKAKKQSG